MLLASNATIGTKRGSYNAGTKQTSAPATHLSNVPVYIREIGNELKAKGLMVDYAARMTFDSSYDVVDGDQVTGYDPLGYASGGADGRSVAPTLIVDHVELHKGMFDSHKTCLLRILRQ